jgi:hypothetical protein
VCPCTTAHQSLILELLNTRESRHGRWVQAHLLLYVLSICVLVPLYICPHISILYLSSYCYIRLLQETAGAEKRAPQKKMLVLIYTTCVLYCYMSSYYHISVIILLNTTTAGEWWVQKRDLKEDIGFHHDKDEVYMYMYYMRTRCTCICII